MKSTLKPIATLAGHGAHIWEVEWSPDGSTLATCSGDWSVALWGAETRSLDAMLERHTSPVVALSWSSNSRHIATVSKDLRFKIWTVALRRAEYEITISRDNVHSPQEPRVVWSPVSDIVGLSVGDRRVLMFERGRDTPSVLAVCTANIQSVSWSPMGDRLAAGLADRSIAIWDVRKRTLSASLVGHHGAVLDIDWAGDGRTLASCSRDETIRIWNIETGRQEAILEGHTAEVFAIRYSPSGRLLASKSDDGSVRLWRVGKWDARQVIREPCQDGGRQRGSTPIGHRERRW